MTALKRVCVLYSGPIGNVHILKGPKKIEVNFLKADGADLELLHLKLKTIIRPLVGI